jgi:phosphoadenosine phosphosulfate reductase
MDERVHVIMVKKKLASGEPCRKCLQAEDMLRRRELWGGVDEVVVADESDPTGRGMQLAQKFGIKTAPFFIVVDGGKERVIDSAIRVAKEVLVGKTAGHGRSAAPLDLTTALWGRDEAALAQRRLQGASPQETLKWVLGRLGARGAIAFSGAEDVVLIDMAVKLGLPFSVFCLDTGRLHAETYRFIDVVRQFYGIDLRVVSPDAQQLEAFVRTNGLFSFYEQGHNECCGVRKIAPLRRILRDYEGWISGQRRDQSPTRADVPVVDWDSAHFAQGMLKVNPLASWSLEQVWGYIREQGVPYNQLHDAGFVSLGCEPCTRALRPGEHERAARWWWEDATKRECGLHASAEGGDELSLSHTK